jgi:hypothetical protein
MEGAQDTFEVEITNDGRIKIIVYPGVSDAKAHTFFALILAARNRLKEQSPLPPYPVSYQPSKNRQAQAYEEHRKHRD